MAPGEATPLLRCRGIRKVFAGTPALDGIAFDLLPGEAVALLGLNGAGKSTLLRVLLDLVAPDAGTVMFAGRAAHQPAAREAVAYLPESFVAPHYLSGEELLVLMLELHGVAYAREAALAECRALDLDPAALARRARDYSKGMSQKLALIACLLARRPLLVLDEPMGGLDPRAHRHCRARLAAARAAGTALLFSTHALPDLPALCDRVLVLHAGRLVFDGTLERFADRGGGILETALLTTIDDSSREAARR